jgi:hypothetical protein
VTITNTANDFFAKDFKSQRTAMIEAMRRAIKEKGSIVLKM